MADEDELRDLQARADRGDKLTPDEQRRLLELLDARMGAVAREARRASSGPTAEVDQMIAQVKALCARLEALAEDDPDAFSDAAGHSDGTPVLAAALIDAAEQVLFHAGPSWDRRPHFETVRESFDRLAAQLETQEEQEAESHEGEEDDDD
ncbi:MAG: hypothetical protein M9894_33275 [Planctomycetes bacterium]|nr:hypothetical protein [Planctomycetota bacterium]